MKMGQSILFIQIIDIHSWFCYVYIIVIKTIRRHKPATPTATLLSLSRTVDSSSLSLPHTSTLLYLSLPCNTSSTPGLTVLTPDSSLRSYIVPTNQHEPFVRTLSSLMHTRENFPVGHPSQIAPSQARLTWRFLRDRLPKKMHLVGMDTSFKEHP
jgi:hypothetical protein